MTTTQTKNNTHCDGYEDGCLHTKAATCSCDCVPCFNAFLREAAANGVALSMRSAS